MIPQRVNVIGTSGSGKSTFSRRLADVLGYPYIEIDKLNWGPNWQETPKAVLHDRLRDCLEQNEWVLDGNYPHAIPVKWKNADLVIWLDYSFALTVSRAFRRAVRRAYTQAELWEGTGNRESFRNTFCSRDSPLYWTITSYKRVRQLALASMRDPSFSHITFIRLRNPREAEAYLTGLSSRKMR